MRIDVIRSGLAAIVLLGFSVAHTATVTVSTASQLQNAVADANASGGNTTIIVADGTYQLTDTLYVNTSNVTIAGQSGSRDKVIIQGDAMSENATVKNVIRVAGANFKIQDVTLRRSGWHLIQIVGEQGANAPVIRNVVFRDAYQQMLKVTTDSPTAPTIFPANGLVENSLFEYTAGIGPAWYIGGIDAHAARNWIVRNNTFRNIASPNTAVSEFAVHFWNASSGNVVEKNVIVNCDRGIGFGLEGKHNTGGIIRNNMIYHANNGAPFADVAIALTESPNTQVYNNTIYLENSFPWTIEYRYASTSGVTIVNNLSNRPVQQREGASGTVTKNVSNAAASWFRNRTTGDLHLTSAVSGVVDAAQGVSGLTDDIDGQARPQGSGIDIGADEFGAAITPKPPTDLTAT